jgi:DHA1 family multidrug resistance protein-like MFS transporter
LSAEFLEVFPIVSHLSSPSSGMETLRDSAFGQIVRLVTRNKVFQFPEEKDAALGERYINAEKSGNMAHHGAVVADIEKEKETDGNNLSSSRTSSTQVDGSAAVNGASQKPVDPEKGRDLYMVDWYGPEDPDVRAANSHGRCIC